MKGEKGVEDALNFIEEAPGNIRNVVTYSNIHLDNTCILVAAKTISTYRITHMKNRVYHYTSFIKKEFLGEETEIVSFPLVPTNREELLQFRRARNPSFILKTNGNLYYGQIPYEMTFPEVDFFGTHLCAQQGHECSRLSAASDLNGGCAKVRNRSRGIEYYSWISRGFETFGTEKDAFIVTDCKHYVSIRK